MEKMKLNIQLFNGSVAIQTITETTDIYTNQSTFTIPAKMTTTGSTYNNSNAYMTMQWKYESDSSWTSLNKQTFGIGKSSSKTKSWTLILTHNNDGTLENVQFRVKWYITDSTNGTTGATTYTPTTIPRGSEFDTLNWNRDTQILLNSTISIPAIQHISPAYHKLEARFMINGNEQLIASWTGVSITNGYISFSFTSEQLSTIYNLMPSQTTHYIRMYLYTYSDSSYSTLIGEESAIWWTGLIPDSVVPSASMTYSEGGDTPSSWGVYVKGKSKLNITLIGSGAYGSTITAHSISGNGYTYNSNTALTNYLSTSENITFTGIVTDSRGRQGSTNFVINVLDYYNPSISTAQVQRCDENGNIDRNGEYLYISYGASISSCGNRNKANAHYKVGYRVHNSGDYTYISLASNVNSYSATGMLYTDGIYAADRGSGTKLELSSLNTYDIQFYVDDTFNPNGQTNTQQLDTGFDLMNFNSNGKAMAIGKVSEAGANEELFEVGIPMKVVENIVAPIPRSLDVSWINGRDASVVRQNANSTGGWQPVASANTNNGDWSIGTLGGSENLFFAYTTDSDYSSQSNNAKIIEITPELKTTLIPLENFIQVSLFYNQTIEQENEIIEFDARSNGSGSKLTLDSTNHRVIIGENVSKVRVSAMVFMENVGSWLSYSWTQIRKNGNVFVGNIQSGTPQYFQSATISSFIIDVSQGDYIDMAINNPSYGSQAFYIRGGANNTYLLVEVVG